MWLEDRFLCEDSEFKTRWDQLEWVTIWIRASSFESPEEFHSEEKWKSVSALCQQVCQNWDDHRGTDWLDSPTFYGSPFGHPESGELEPDLWMAWIYDKNNQNVKDFWMPRREERIQQAGKTVATAVKAIEEDRPKITPLDTIEVAPKFADDGRSLRTARLTDRTGIDTLLADAEAAMGEIHNGVLMTFQVYLNDLVGQALPTLEGNQHLAKRVLEMADKFGVKLFMLIRESEVKQVRIAAAGVPRLKNQDSPAAVAGKFLVIQAGDGSKKVRESVTFPELAAAREVSQAERFFGCQRETPPQS